MALHVNPRIKSFFTEFGFTLFINNKKFAEFQFGYDLICLFYSRLSPSFRIFNTGKYHS